MALTPLQLDAAAGLLQNQGISVNADLTASITDYESIPAITAIRNTIITASSGNILSAGNLTAVKNLGNTTCPALADSVPAAYPTLITVNADPGLTGVVQAQAFEDIGSGDVSKFTQALAIAQGYGSQTNLFVNSAVNSQTYMATTFTNMNDMITGDITQVNLATGPFGQDLANLGKLIDLGNLGNLGTPLALVQRIQVIGGNVPVLAVYFIAAGVPQEIVVNLDNPSVSVTDSVQQLMYNAMTQITGDDLQQILTVLAVTTVGIETMADLLNPVKLFPNSYQTLTVSTAVGLRAIYINDQGTVNSSLAEELPIYILSSLV
jgi:type IV secretory pathway VirB2 component (pilin)